MRKIFFSICLCLIATLTFSQNTIQSPEDFLPTDYGNHFTPHHLLVDYYEYVAENSGQVILNQYGRTNERRPLLTAVISSPDNLSKLETIRTDNLKRAGLMEGELSGNKPVAIVWLSYGVHGNEAGGSESAPSVLYELVRPGNDKMQNLLENAVVIIDPSINPDGYSRYTHWNWNAANKLVTPNPESREHNEPWPGGRVNHYYFDLNRDWAWQTQVETQQRLEVYHQWMPHIHVDYHEMGSNSPYYFAPAAQPYHDYITDWQGEFQAKVGKNHASYFDKNGWLFYTKEVFDLFYPSYGDTYPIFNGAVGMTHEQAGHGRAGRAILLNNEDTLTIRDRINHHVTTSMSNIEVSANNAEKLVENFARYFKNAIEKPQGEYVSFIIPSDNEPSKIKALTQLLDKHRIQYGTAGKSIKVKDLYNYGANKNASYAVKSDDIIISAYQPKGVFTQVLFEPNPFLIDSLTYDITAWSLPHAFGLKAFASKDRINPEAKYTPPVYRKPSNLGKPTAYFAHWNSLADARFLGQLHQKDIKVRTATKAFTSSGVDYPIGTLVITRADNRKHSDFDLILQSIAANNEKIIAAAATGLSDKGPDLGSGSMKLLETPNIALVYSDRISGNAFGHVWHYIENDLEYPLTVLSDQQISYADLNQYDVILIPSGRPNLNLDKLKSWIRDGGTLITMGGSVGVFAGKDGFNLKRKSSMSSDKPKEDMKDNHKLESYGDQERDAISDQMPGAIFKTHVDNTHPLAYGLPDYYYTLKTSSAAYELLEDDWNVSFIPEQLEVLGFAGANAKKDMKNTLTFGTQSMGRGQVVYMIDNPAYRGFWRNGKFVLSNALFMVP
jgi:hypothetical protein